MGIDGNAHHAILKLERKAKLVIRWERKGQKPDSVGFNRLAEPTDIALRLEQLSHLSTQRLRFRQRPDRVLQCL